MRTFALALWFVWQAITPPFHPDPLREVEAAETWLKDHLQKGLPFTPALMEQVQSAGFSIRQVEEKAWDRSWPGSGVSRVYICSKTIPSRPSWQVTHVRAILALDKKSAILFAGVSRNLTSL